jgi:hypothetical protein
MVGKWWYDAVAQRSKGPTVQPMIGSGIGFSILSWSERGIMEFRGLFSQSAWRLLFARCAIAAVIGSSLALVAEAQAPAETGSTPAPAAVGTPAPAEHVAALKESVKRDQANLKQYEWIETTVVSLKGEEKSRTQENCYYGADGKLQKVAVGDKPDAEGKKHGVRGKVVENKKEEVSSYMTSAVAAIKKYVPPDAARIQAVQAAGKATMAILEPNKRVRIDLHDYAVPGDVLGVEMDIVTNKILGLDVTTLIEGGKDPVNLQVTFASLEDGTGYPAKTTLDAKEVGVGVSIENSGYKKQSAQATSE